MDHVDHAFWPSRQSLLSVILNLAYRINPFGNIGIWKELNTSLCSDY